MDEDGGTPVTDTTSQEAATAVPASQSQSDITPPQKVHPSLETIAEGNEDNGDDDLVGPTLPKARKRRVRLRPSLSLFKVQNLLLAAIVQ